MFDFNTEQLIERLNLLLQHYQSGSAIGNKLDHSLALLQLQLGTNICPLDLNYDEWGIFAPVSWIKMLWKTLQVSGFEVHLKYEVIKAPRNGDKLLMELAMSVCKDDERMMSFSRVRGFLEAMFLSDITTIDGKYIEEWAVMEGVYENRSNLDYPKEQPTKNDWKVWVEIIKSITTSNYGLMTPLGEWKNKSHRIWKWYKDPTHNLLYHNDNDAIVVYEQKKSSRAGKWSKSEKEGYKLNGVPVSIKISSNGNIKIRAVGKKMGKHSGRDINGLGPVEQLGRQMDVGMD